MGFDHSTYVGYGVHVPSDRYEGYADDESERIDAFLRSFSTPDHARVGHLTAGGYDRNELFIICGPKYDPKNPLTHSEVELGTHRKFPASWFLNYERREWDTYLRQVVSALGYGDLGEPGWLVIPDVS